MQLLVFQQNQANISQNNLNNNNNDEEDNSDEEDSTFWRKSTILRLIIMILNFINLLTIIDFTLRGFGVLGFWGFGAL